MAGRRTELSLNGDGNSMNGQKSTTHYRKSQCYRTPMSSAMMVDGNTMLQLALLFSSDGERRCSITMPGGAALLCNNGQRCYLTTMADDTTQQRWQVARALLCSDGR
ncbi:unnamed protein product [Sphagnum balticum]